MVPMKRNIPNSNDEPLDLLVVGGGIHGAAMAYYGALNTLKVGLVEKDDFCAHTSANSQKVIHGGLRYLQSLDIKRVLESIRERQRFYALFPHLVQPMGCVLPLSGWATKSREAMGIAFIIYRFLQKLIYREGLAAHQDKQPVLLSVDKLKAMFPGLATEKLRGAAYWYDGLCVEPERAIIALLKRAASLEASIANYAELTSIKRIDASTLSVVIKDRLTGCEHTCRTRKIALCTGPWLKDTFGLGAIPEELEKLRLISGVNIITEKLTDAPASIALKPKNRERPGFFFVLPWKNCSISGTIWENGGSIPRERVDASETAQQLNSEVHDSYIQSKQKPAILHTHFGYVPGTADTRKKPAECILPHYLLVDREREKSGDILQVVGVKFTTAFDVSYKALVKLFPQHQLTNVHSAHNLPIGSPVDDESRHLSEIQEQYLGRLPADKISTLFSIVGTELPWVLDTYILQEKPDKESIATNEEILRGMTGFFICEEMVVSLEDLIQRRFFAGGVSSLQNDELQTIAEEMASILKWTPEQLQSEIESSGAVMVTV